MIAPRSSLPLSHPSCCDDLDLSVQKHVTALFCVTNAHGTPALSHSRLPQRPPRSSSNCPRKRRPLHNPTGLTCPPTQPPVLFNAARAPPRRLYEHWSSHRPSPSVAPHLRRFVSRQCQRRACADAATRAGAVCSRPGCYSTPPLAQRAHVSFDAPPAPFLAPSLQRLTNTASASAQVSCDVAPIL